MFIRSSCDTDKNLQVIKAAGVTEKISRQFCQPVPIHDAVER